MSLKKLEEKWPGICNAVSSAMVQKDTPEEPQQACQRCPCILSRISAIPGFDDAPYPSRAIHEFRAEVDKVVRETTGDMATAKSLGYPIGRLRWAAAGEDTVAERNPRGRPSQVNDAENVSKVREILEKYSRPSSDPCLNNAREWVPSRTMTKRRSTIFQESKLEERMWAPRLCGANRLDAYRIHVQCLPW